MKYPTDEYPSYSHHRDWECDKHKYKCCKDAPGICINNSPVIKICVNGSENGTEEPTPFLSSYLEALGGEQIVPTGTAIAFDSQTVDSVGGQIDMSDDGTLFTIQQPGLYQVSWNLNLANDTTAAVVGILENGEPASGSATVTGGNFSSGTLIQVDEVPFTLSLYNFNGEIELEDIAPFANSAASIRIVRFADGPTE